MGLVEVLSNREGRLVPNSGTVPVHAFVKPLTGFSHIPCVGTFLVSNEVYDAPGVTGVVAPDVVSGLIPCDCCLRAEVGAC